MGRPPSNGAPSFRFNPAEVAQMEAILKKHEGHVPPRDLLVVLAQRFSQSPERAGKIVVQMKQVWNWFQNRRYALRAKLVESYGKPTTSPVTRDEDTPMRNVPNVPSVPQQMAVSSGPHVAGNTSEAPLMEFEARSARDGAWYDVQIFLSLRYLETGNPEVLVRFAGFGPEEDEWVNILKHVRQRSLPCEASECIAVLPGDLILCFQEGKEQALYFDAHVLDAQRRRHDVRGCRCRFLVRYDHDQSEEIVPLRKICRRPETDYRLQQLNATNEAPASTSASVGPPSPVVDLTSTTTSGMTTPYPITAPLTVSPSPIVSAGPSVRLPAPISAPAPTLVRAPTPSPVGPPSSTPFPSSVVISNFPPTSVSTSTPPPTGLPVAESDNPAQIPVPDQKKVESDNPAQIPVPDQKKIEGVNPAQISVPDLKKVESVNPAQFSVPDPKMVESVNPAQISVPDPKKVESDNSAPVLVPVLEVNKVETVSSTPDLVPLPGPCKVETGIPAFVPVTLLETSKNETDNSALAPVPELNKVESDNSAAPLSVPELNKIASDNLVSVPDSSKVESDIPISVPEPNKVESDIPISALDPSKVESDIPISVPELKKVESDISISAPESDILVSVPELNKVESDIPISALDPSKVESDIPISVPELKKVESDIPISAPEGDILVSVPDPNKAENDTPISAPEPNKVGSDIPVSAPEPIKAGSVNLGTSDSEAGAQANVMNPGAVNKILEAKQAVNSKPETVVLMGSNVSEEQLIGNLTITVPGPEKTAEHHVTGTMSTVAGSTESTVATEDVKE